MFKLKDNIKVINFHEVYDVKWFEDIIIYLKNNKKIISCDDLYSHLDNQVKLKESYLLTVDDGHKSFYDNIFPVIKKHKVPIALFASPKICKEKENFWWQEIENFDNTLFKKIFSDIINIPGTVLNEMGVISIIKSIKIEEVLEAISRYQKIAKVNNKPFQNMTVDNLLELKKTGLVTIGAHTMNHPILHNEDNDVSKYEIEESINELSNILNEEIKYFAYPNGIPKIDYSDREMKYVKSKGIKISFSTKFKKVTRADNLMEIPRGEISNGKFNFKNKLFLWEYWNSLSHIKNGNKTLNERKILLNMLKNN